MSAIITEKFRQHNANQFVESFSEAAASTYYLFLGKSTAFSSTTTGGTDSSPPTPGDSPQDEFRAWDSMLGAKIITSSDVKYAVARRTGQMVQLMICTDMIILHQILLLLGHQIFMTQLSIF